MSRRWSGALTMLLAVALTVVGVPAPARASAYADWSGSFTAAYADPAVVPVDASGVVRFTVSHELYVPGTWSGYVVIRDASGTSVKSCWSGTECLWYVNPQPGATQTFTAELRTTRNDQIVVIGTAGPVSVTDAGWGGSLAYARADNPFPVISESTLVRFGVSEPLKYARVRVTDQAGNYVTDCSSGVECQVSSNPETGETNTYIGHLFVELNGAMVERSTATVSVTDPGWLGDFSYAYADNSSPALDQSTVVRFGVSAPLSAADVEITDEKGASVTSCIRGNECLMASNPSPGEVKTYTARLRVQLNGHWVERSTRSVTVTDPGWTGTITPLATNQSFVAAGSMARPTFVTSAPRGMANVNVYVDGVLRNTCNAQGGDLLCNANFGVGANEVHVVRADVVPYLIGGTQEVRASATSVVTSMTQAQLADALLSNSPPPQLGALLTPQVLDALTVFKAATNTLESCFKLGVAIPGNRKYGSTVSDATLDCTAIVAVASAGAVAVMAEALKTESVQTVLGAVAEVFVPGYGGGGGGSTTDPGDTGGGGTADHSWYLGSQTAGAVTYSANAPYAWTSGQMICRVQTTDPATGEPVTVELDAEQLAHIINEHLANVPAKKSKWDDIFREGVSDEELPTFQNDLLPENFQELIKFICGDVLTGTPTGYGNSANPDTPDNKVWTYEFSSEVTTGTKGSLDTSSGNLVTVYIEPDGRVASAHPGSTTSE